MARLARFVLSRPAVMFYAMAAPLWCRASVTPGTLRGWIELLSPFVLAGSVALWIVNDSAKQRRTLPFDLTFCVFATWPVFAPAYLFHTRGWRAFFPLGCFVGLYLAATLLGSVPVVLHGWRH